MSILKLCHYRVCAAQKGYDLRKNSTTGWRAVKGSIYLLFDTTDEMIRWANE